MLVPLLVARVDRRSVDLDHDTRPPRIRLVQLDRAGDRAENGP
jgi:hypothetical protein